MVDSFEVSISDKALGKGNVREGLQLLREHGFSHVHFSQGWTSTERIPEETVEQWQIDLEATGMAVLDVHGCHPHHKHNLNIWVENPDDREAALDLFKSRLEITHALGGDAMVYHVPTRVAPEQDVIDRFIDSLARMEDAARELGIIVALENHFLPENDLVTFEACFERFSPDYIGLTFDSGHAIRSGNTDWLIENCFDRLKVLHLHDNEPGYDRHWLPMIEGGHVDWDKVSRAIVNSPYDKPLQFEIGWKPKRHPEQLDFIKQAYESAVAVQQKVDAYRAERK